MVILVLRFWEVDSPRGGGGWERGLRIRDGGGPLGWRACGEPFNYPECKYGQSETSFWKPLGFMFIVGRIGPNNVRVVLEKWLDGVGVYGELDQRVQNIVSSWLSPAHLRPPHAIVAVVLLVRSRHCLPTDELRMVQFPSLGNIFLGVLLIAMKVAGHQNE